MNLNIRIILISLCLISFVSCKKNQEVNISVEDEFVMSDIISNQNVTSIEEDVNGYIWLGTARGINKYNGYEFYQYFSSSDTLRSLRSNYIVSIFKDKKNRLWVATDKGVSLQQEDNSFKTIPLPNTTYTPMQISESKGGEIVVNLGSQLCKYDTINNKFNEFYSFKDYNISNKYHIDKSDHLWIIDINSITCLDFKTLKQIRKYTIEKQVNLFYSYLIDDLLFVEHGKGDLKILNTKTLEEEYLSSLSNDPVLSQAIITIVHKYSPNEILLNTHKNGLFLFNTKTNKLIHHTEKDFPFKVPQSEITTMFTDMQDNLWIGTMSRGFKVVYKYSQQFNTKIKLYNLLLNQSVTAITLDRNENLWIATSMDNLYIYNLITDEVKYIDLKKFFLEDPFFQDKISSILVDLDNTVWIQSNAKLTKCFYRNNKLERNQVFNNGVHISDLVEDGKGTKWLSTRESYIYAMPKGQELFHKISLYPKSLKNYSSKLLKLSNGNVLVATSKQYLCVINKNDWSIERFSMEELISREDFIPTAIYQSSDNEIYIGIQNKGLYKYSLEDKKAEFLDGISCKDISSIIEDSDKNLWLGTLYGLSKYDINKKLFFTFYSYDGIGGNQFNYKSAINLRDSNLVFGGTHGLTIFNPSIVNNHRKIPLYFEKMKSIGFSQKTEKIHLPYYKNDLNISFVALDYSNYHRVRYYYKMEGLDNVWIDARNSRKVSYSNMPPGDYTFRVYISSNDNPDILAENSFDISVSSSPWLSPWAIFLYVIFTVGLIVYINYLYLRIKNNKNLAQIALREKDYEKYVNKMNMSFFTNISHEFRTPLTMISGPISTILNSDSLDAGNRYLLNVVNRSVTRMLRLVNQILNFNQLENDALSLKMSYIDIVHEIHEIVEIFSINDNNKNLKITLNGLQTPFFTMFDKDKLEKILNNLLSNAFKFSPNGGQIIISFRHISSIDAKRDFNLIDPMEYDNYIKITMEDEGPGIPKDKLEDIFLKFYQVDHESQLGDYNWGTGIGLYFSQRLVTMHHGYIKAATRDEGGAIFTMIFPVENSQDLLIDEAENQDTSITFKANSDIFQPCNDKLSENKYTILIIDDDVEIASYLNSMLSDNYNVITKYRADTGYTSLEDIEPDLILCDIVMPGMSGLDFCKKIKASQDYCHIPVILLTAKSSLQEQIEGLEFGSNAYIPKPFDPEYLIAVIKSQIFNIQKSRALLGNSTQIPSNNSLSTNDTQLMKKVYELMELELSNTEMNITEMAKTIGMSRTKFYHKIKGLTDENPNVLFRKYKLNRAAELIKKGDNNISEIALMTGFSTLSHFSVSFKKQFGVTPKEYR